MAQAIQKITLNGARDIPFNKLALSQKNVRNIKAGVSIEELAQDIARRGILSSLNVRPELDADGKETGLYRVPAGGRRYRALELLVKQKRLNKTAGVPCIVSDGTTSEVEDSLAENVRRLDLHPLDQFRAFRALADEGLSDEDIAARFFIVPAVVRQRLRLTSVSPALLDLYAEGQMTIGQVEAFSISGDHARQEQVWDTISRQHNREPYYIRRLLTETTVRAGDRRAVYVGIEAYEAAGGVVMRDLFEQDNGGWLQDPALLEQLVFEKMKIDGETLRTEEGWKWVDHAIDFHHGHAAGLRRFYGKQQPATEEQLSSQTVIQTEYDQLEADYAASEVYSEETEARLEELGAELDAFNDRPYLFDAEDVAIGGAFVSLAVDGTLKIERGFVRPEDEPKVEEDEIDGEIAAADLAGTDQNESAVPGNPAANGQPAVAVEPEEEDDRLRPLSDRLVEDLTATRTMALRNALANDPAIAFIAVLHALTLKVFYRSSSETCMEITFQQMYFSQTQGLKDTVWAKEIEERQTSWGQDLPRESGDLWDFLMVLDEASRQALFAHCIALSLNAVNQGWNHRRGPIAHADQIAHAIGFDMADQGWTPTVDSYLGRVPKARILEAVREAKGEDAAQLIDHLKKPDMAREAERLLAGSGWLPEPLRLPVNEVSGVTHSASDIPEYEVGADDMTGETTDAELPAFLTEEHDDVDPASKPEEAEPDEFRHLDAAE